MAGKKRKQKKLQQKKPQHQPALDADEDSVVSKKIARYSRQRRKGDKMISSDVSSKILKEPLTQQKEILQEEEAHKNFPQVAYFDSEFDSEFDSDELSDDEGCLFDGFFDSLSPHDLGVEEIKEEDEAALAEFSGDGAVPQLTLADIVIKKIKEKDAQASSEERPMPKFGDGFIDLYKKVGNVLSRYTSGKLPNALHRIATMERWEEVLYITEPEKWSLNAMYHATLILVMQFDAFKTQKFYEFVLLPRVREEIQKNKRLHRALYEAVKSSFCSGPSFIEGILFPLYRSQTCTLIEAHIIGSFVKKESIKPIDSSIALSRLAEMDYNWTTSFFMKLLLEKNYWHPYALFDHLVAHFMRFLEEKRAMPVIWHQTLLAFVQRYKYELTQAHKNDLDRLLQHQKHDLFTPEILRELKDNRHRGEEDITSQDNLSIQSVQSKHDFSKKAIGGKKKKRIYHSRPQEVAYESRHSASGESSETIEAIVQRRVAFMIAEIEARVEARVIADVEARVVADLEARMEARWAEMEAKIRKFTQKKEPWEAKDLDDDSYTEPAKPKQKHP